MSDAFRPLLVFVVLATACSSSRSGSDGGSLGDGGTRGDGSAADTCVSCLSDADCAGQRCVQLADDTYCEPTCTNGSSCASDESCITVSSTTGDQVSVCVDNTNVCGTGPVALDMGARSDASTSQQCGSLVGPNVSAGCHSCSGSNCQTNGCYGGWWCNTSTDKCQPAPSSCAGSDGGSGGTDGGTMPGGTFGTTPTGQVTASGGTLSRLLFAVVGDTRPPSIDDTSGYPSTIATKIFTEVQSMSARPAFIVSTGDYQFATPTGTQSGPQLDDYLACRGAYSGTVFPAMGNHECSGYTASNCIAGSSDLTNNHNYANFVSKLLAPINQTKPYYSVAINAADASWTAKLVFVAANAWDATQSTWLETTLSQATTYTFILRHEPTEANTAPGVKPSDTIIAKHPYTMLIVGHTHTYKRASQQQVVIGNGGAPLTGSSNYGYGVFSQQADGSITVDMIDYSTQQLDPSFHFAVKADGSPAP